VSERKYIKIYEDILARKDITIADKMVLAEIEALSHKQRCTASITQIAQFLGISRSTGQRAILNLLEKKLISCECDSRGKKSYTLYQNDTMCQNEPMYQNESLYQNDTHRCSKMTHIVCQNDTGVCQNDTLDNIDNIDNKKEVVEATSSKSDISQKDSIEFNLDREILDLYQDNIHAITPIEYEKLMDDVEHYGREWVSEAIKRAVLRGKRTLGYIEGILRGWETNGFDDGSRKQDEKDNLDDEPLHPYVRNMEEYNYEIG